MQTCGMIAETWDGHVDSFAGVVGEFNSQGSVCVNLNDWVWSGDRRLEFVGQTNVVLLACLFPNGMVMGDALGIGLDESAINETLSGFLNGWHVSNDGSV